MKVLLLINHVIIALFGVASGVFKVVGGQADLDVFSHLGMGPVAVALFGGVQVLAAVATMPARSRKAGALLLAACNALATAGLFAAGVQPFGVISVAFMVMALLVLRREGSREREG